MGQSANERRVSDNEAMAMLKNLRSSPQKVNLVAQTIRGKSAGTALIDLEFNNRRISQDVRKCLQSAIANAENNHGLDVDRLFVAEAYVGKDLVMKRFRPRARGRAAAILKPFSRLTIIVREREDEAVAKKASSKVDVTKSAPKEAAKTEEKKAPAKKAAAKTTAKKAPAKKADAKKTTPNKDTK
jgi:large subunit ribosomal protein L22